MQATPVKQALLIAAIGIALAACAQGDAPPSAAGKDDRPDREWTDAARVEAVASALQACSYDGAPVTVNPGQLNAPAPADCKRMVDRIMGFTGLPANFVVGAGPVPNAVAVILPDKQQQLHRVIAFNPDFIQAMQRLTGGGEWGPISIMAHEIGHHLSGHTITESGSRPPVELEADKFSGFVLYKMGAPLAEATRAIAAIGSETERPTHPARSRRIAAITQGWQEACRQATGSGCQAGTSGSAAMPGTSTATVALPAPSSSSIPLKYGRFVVDEFGRLEPGQVQALDRELYDFAAKHGVEIALLVVKDLAGMRPEDYAWAMMRQLRIGKLDVGNGAVIVVAPELNQAGVAYGPGVDEEMAFSDPKRQLEKWIEGAWDTVCIKQGSCRGWTETLFMLPRQIMRNTAPLEWGIRYQSMQAFVDAYAAQAEADMKRPASEPYDPKRNVAFDKLVRFRGKVVNLDTPVGISMPKVPKFNPNGGVNAPEPVDILSNAAIVKRGYLPVHVQTEEGIAAVVYVNPKLPSVMPAGELAVGKQYSFVGRVQSPGGFTGAPQHLWALSYDPI